MISVICFAVDLAFIIGNGLLTYFNVNELEVKLVYVIIYICTTLLVQWKLNNLSKSTSIATIVHILFICSLLIF